MNLITWAKPGQHEATLWRTLQDGEQLHLYFTTSSGVAFVGFHAPKDTMPDDPLARSIVEALRGKAPAAGGKLRATSLQGKTCTITAERGENDVAFVIAAEPVREAVTR